VGEGGWGQAGEQGRDGMGWGGGTCVCCANTLCFWPWPVQAGNTGAMLLAIRLVTMQAHSYKPLLALSTCNTSLPALQCPCLANSYH